MARGPVQMQGRGGAATGEVGNRAQYLRPALDNQNSRMLAKAFSQINSSLGRIASNEARLAERRRSDEYKDAKDYQAEQNEMAKQLGQLSSLTGEDYTDQFWNNPANMVAYNESNIIGGIDRELADFMMNMENSPEYGDPQGREQFQSNWTDFATQTLENTPAELRGEVAARISKAGVQHLVKSDAVAVERANQQKQANATSAMRRSFLTSENSMELGGQILLERETLVKMNGTSRGNDMFLKALTTDIENLVHQVKPEQAQMNIDQMYELLSNEDFTKQFGSGEGGAIDQLAQSLAKAQRNLNLHTAALQAEAEQAREVAKMDLVKRTLRDPHNMNSYIPEFEALFGEDGKKEFDKVVERRNFLNSTAFLTDDMFGRSVSAQNLRELKNELDEKNLDSEEFQDFIFARQGMLTQSDFEKLIQYEAKVPEAMDHPMVKGLLADTAAMADFADIIMQEDVNMLSTGDASKSAIANAYKSFVRDYIENNSEQYTEALRNGSVDQFMNTLANDAAAYILDYNFTGEETYTSLREKLNETIRGGGSVIDLSNNVAFRRYFANEELIRQIEEQESLAETSAANNPDLDRLESMVDDSIEMSEADTVEQNLGADNPASIMARFNENMGDALGDDDGDGIINAREDILTRERVGREISKTAAADPEAVTTASTPAEFAKGYLGQTESANHAVLTKFIQEVNPGMDDVRKTAWCAGFVNAVLNEAGSEGTGKLNARSFMNWGQSVSDPKEGDVVVLWRESPDSWKGHVGFFAGYDDNGDIKVLGGNQGNSVSIKSYSKNRLLGFRRSN